MSKRSICPTGLEEITVETFAADERPDLAALYIAGQADSLRRHLGDVGLRVGELGEARIVLARDREGRAQGGMRVHLRRPGVPLPVERALADRCAIAEAIARAPAPLVELCGTWIGASYRKSPLAEVVTRAALGAARSLGARRIVGCAHQHVLDFYRRFGAVVDPELGVHPYPDARYETSVFWADPNFCADADTVAVDTDGGGIKSFVSGPVFLFLMDLGGIDPDDAFPASAHRPGPRRRASAQPAAAPARRRATFPAYHRRSIMPTLRLAIPSSCPLRSPAFASPLLAACLLAACNGGDPATTDSASTTTGDTTTTGSTTDDTPTTTGTTTDPTVTGTSGSTTGEPLPPAEVPPGCNPIAYEADCMLPYPSDWFLVPDAELPNGVRVALTPEATPKTKDDIPLDNLAAHPADGFSHHMPILALFPGGIDPMNLTFHLDGGDATLAATSPTLLINTATHELVPHWVELDAMTDDPTRQVLIVRPFVRLDDSTRYIVAFQGLVDTAGVPVAPPLGFAHLVAGDVAGHPVLEPLAQRYESDIFPELDQLGVARDQLQLAWDFTTASDERNTRDLRTIRDDIIATFDQAPPVVQIDQVLPDYSAEFALRVEGRIEVPLYLEANEPMARLHRGPDGVVTPNGTTWADFTLQVPVSAYPAGPGFQPARIIQFGHGFFGEREEINWSAMRDFSTERGFIMIATDWVGMSAEDQGDVVTNIATDPANAFLFTDRLHQGFANQLALSYAIKTSLAESPDLTAFGELLYDPDQLAWYGISQGSIFGMVVLALTPTLDKGVLDVGGGPYTLMMTRSGSFTDLFAIMKAAMGDDPLMIQKFIMLSQHTWDRVDPLTYAPRVNLDPYPQSSEPTVLFTYGIGDHSVNNLASHLLLRAAGWDLLDPAAQSVWGLGTVASPAPGSAGVPVDFQLPELPGIEASIPPDPPDEYNVHEKVRRNPKIRDQIDAFMSPGGLIENFCDGPCDPE